MTNNDVLRRVRYIFDYSDTKMMALFALGEQTVTRTQLSSWLKKDDDDDYEEINDKLLASFLNGLIVEKRGAREGVAMPAETQINNNIILKKLKIALNLTAEDLIDLLSLAEFRLSKSELSAFFRKAGHKHYRTCKDQVLRNVLNGLKLRHRDKIQAPEKFNPWTSNNNASST